jgi:hypothetical protein
MFSNSGQAAAQWTCGFVGKDGISQGNLWTLVREALMVLELISFNGQ